MDNATTVYTLKDLQDMRHQVNEARHAISEVYTMPGSTLSHRAWKTALNALDREYDRIDNRITAHLLSD